ncbi:hypothetical protein OU789_10805 [Halocynthiibacter sp. C4]|uniref:hypothetical protein n=1 Tax=Halocynthiibacter sp. C4 TaxID=2992758 RepID=UPI00237C186D|nr:hypothetical protein [Halocynthiibacter sp. C4]MDE0590416.1 hypothetical protein [Halocynthiibacter sp. C4]
MSDQLKAALLEKAKREKARRTASPQNPDGSYGQIPEGMFVNPETGQITSREMLKANVDTSQGQAAANGYMQGMSFNTTDELMGVAGRVEGALRPDVSREDMSTFRREQARANMEANAEAFPKTAAAGEVTGAVLNPVNKVVGPVNTMTGAAKVGAGYAAGYAAGGSEGNAKERAKDAAIAAPIGALFGAAGKKAIDAGSRGFQHHWGKVAEKPTVEGLRAVKNQAYKAVDESGVTFSPVEIKTVLNNVKNSLDGVNYVAGVDKQTGAALQTIANLSKGPVTMGQLDRVRQSLWRRYNAAPSEKGILEAIDAIDELVMSKGSTSKLMDTARAANSRYKKAELLDLAFKKAERQTAGSGSGGNILNKYKQAVTSILNDPKRSKWFSQDEVEMMEKFVRGSFTQDKLRLAGKLSPSGNGLMLALNLGAAAADPSMLLVGAAGQAAKTAADRAGTRGKDRLLEAVGGYVAPRAASVPSSAGAASGALADETKNYLAGL